MELLSIIVPVYNSEKYLSTLINSILHQNYSNYELILVDDGSKDQSGMICDSFAKKHDRIKVIHKNNGGQGSARNVGLAEAKGKYITFADNDDYVDSKMYSTLIHILEETDGDVCACNFLNVNDSKFSMSFNYPNYNYSFHLENKEQILMSFFKPTWRVPVWNKVYKKSVLENIKFVNVHLGEDNLFSYEVISKAEKYYFCNGTFYFQRMHGNNYEFTASDYLIDLLSVKELILKDIVDNFSNCYNKCRKDFIYECIRIYNSYPAQEKDIKQSIIKKILSNCKGIFKSDLPLAHKILIGKIKIMNLFNICPDKIVV